jgi:hypothetical protein
MTVHDHSTRSSSEPVQPVTQWTPMVQASPPAGFAGPGGTPGRKKVNPKLAIVGGLVAVAVASAGITAGIMAGTGGGSSSAAGPGGAGAGGFGGPGGGGFSGGGGMSVSAITDTNLSSGSQNGGAGNGAGNGQPPGQ